MSQTLRNTIVGTHPPTHRRQRLDERRNRERALRQERRRKPDKPDDFVTYEDSDSDDETPFQQAETLRTSYNFVDFVRSRESHLRERRSVNWAYGSRHILTHDMYRERAILLGNCNKVFCSQWLSNRQVVFGTKCNKLMVYDVNMRRVDAIPTLSNGQMNGPESQNGIHAIQINPSRTLLATGARHSADVAVYRLPTLDPVGVGVNGHRDWVMDLCWMDDQFLVSGSKDAKMALWRISEDIFDLDADEEEQRLWRIEERENNGGGGGGVQRTALAQGRTGAGGSVAAAASSSSRVPSCAHITPISVKDCRAAQKASTAIVLIVRSAQY